MQSRTHEQRRGGEGTESIFTQCTHGCGEQTLFFTNNNNKNVPHLLFFQSPRNGEDLSDGEPGSPEEASSVRESLTPDERKQHQQLGGGGGGGGAGGAGSGGVRLKVRPEKQCRVRALSLFYSVIAGQFADDRA